MVEPEISLKMGSGSAYASTQGENDAHEVDVDDDGEWKKIFVDVNIFVGG